MVTSPQSLKTRIPGRYAGTLSQRVCIYIYMYFPGAGLGTRRKHWQCHWTGVGTWSPTQTTPDLHCQWDWPFCYPSRSQVPILQVGRYIHTHMCTHTHTHTYTHIHEYTRHQLFAHTFLFVTLWCYFLFVIFSIKTNITFCNSWYMQQHWEYKI